MARTYCCVVQTVASLPVSQALDPRVRSIDVDAQNTVERYTGRNAACGVRDAKRSPSRVVLSLKVRLNLQVCRCELSAAFHWRPNEQALLYHRAPFGFRS